MSFPVYEMRPLPADCKGDVFRYANGQWLPDDGEWDLAFAVPGQCRAYGISLGYHENIAWSWLTTHWRGYQARHPRENPWHYSARDGGVDWGPPRRDYWTHENRKAHDAAMNFVCSKSRCANGSGPEFNVANPYMLAGLVREQITSQIVRIPEQPTCIYCGLEWYEEKILQELETW